MAAEDYLSALPLPSVDETALGLPPLPPPPVAPSPMDLGPSRQEKLMAVAGLIGAAIAGRQGGGIGAAQGTLRALQQRQAQRRYDAEQAFRQYQVQQDDYLRAQQLHQAEAQRRQQTIQDTVDDLRSRVPSLTTKDDYDRWVSAYATGLRQLGYRLDENFLRSAVPYVAPDASKKAREIVEQFIKVPGNLDLLKARPNTTIDVDRDGDGVPERVKVLDLARIAGVFGFDPESGNVVLAPDGEVDLGDKLANFYYQRDLAQARAEGKAITDDFQKELASASMREAQKVAGMSPYQKAQIEIDRARLGLQQQAQAKQDAAQAPRNPLAEMAATNPEVLQGVTPTIAGEVMQAIAGDPELRQRYERTRMEPVRAQAQMVLDTLSDLIEVGDDGSARLTPGARGLYEVGPGRLARFVPGSPEANAKAALDRVTGNLVLDIIRAMKEQSRTGATGFGQLSNRELALLEASASVLKGEISRERALKELKSLYDRFQKILLPSADEAQQLNFRSGSGNSIRIGNQRFTVQQVPD